MEIHLFWEGVTDYSKNCSLIWQFIPYEANIHKIAENHWISFLMVRGHQIYREIAAILQERKNSETQILNRREKVYYFPLAVIALFFKPGFTPSAFTMCVYIL